MSAIEIGKENTKVKNGSTYFMYSSGLSILLLSYFCILYYLSPFTDMESTMFFISIIVLCIAYTLYFYCIIIYEYIDYRLLINSQKQKELFDKYVEKNMQHAKNTITFNIIHEGLLFSNTGVEEIIRNIPLPLFKSYGGLYISDDLKSQLNLDSSLFVCVLYRSITTNNFFIYKHKIINECIEPLSSPIQTLTTDEAKNFLSKDIEVYKRVFHEITAY